MSSQQGQLSGPDFVAFQVRDLEASRSFYVEKVGLTPNPKCPPEAVVFQTAPIPFAIRKPLVDLSSSTKLGWGVALWMHTDDAEALHSRLQAQGVRILGPVTKGNFGRQFTFVDPDGYAITAHDG
jgi:predicted enzyme related to lactoylglutathione lyase